MLKLTNITFQLNFMFVNMDFTIFKPNPKSLPLFDVLNYQNPIYRLVCFLSKYGYITASPQIIKLSDLLILMFLQTVWSK